jgi:hypothetical protein
MKVQNKEHLRARRRLWIRSKKVTREAAMKVFGAAVDRANALNCHVSIAVVDNGDI